MTHCLNCRYRVRNGSCDEPCETSCSGYARDPIRHLPVKFLDRATASCVGVRAVAIGRRAIRQCLFGTAWVTAIRCVAVRVVARAAASVHGNCVRPPLISADSTDYGMQQESPARGRSLESTKRVPRVLHLSVGRHPSNDLTIGAGWRIRQLKIRLRAQTGDKYMRKITTLAGAVVLLSLTSGSAFSQVIYRLTELNGPGFCLAGTSTNRGR